MTTGFVIIESKTVSVCVCVYMRRSENMPWLGNGREHTPTHTDCLLMNGWTTSTVLTGWTRVLLITTWSLNTSIVRAKRGVRTRDVTSERVTVATHLFLQREIFIVFTFSVLVKIWDGFSHIISSQRLEVRTLSKVNKFASLAQIYIYIYLFKRRCWNLIHTCYLVNLSILRGSWRLRKKDSRLYRFLSLGWRPLFCTL